MELTKSKIKSDLIRLGIVNEDIVFLTIDIMRVGYFHKNKSITLNDWIDVLTDLVGKNGAVILAAYSELFDKINKKNLVFTKTSKSSSGSLPNAFIKDERSVRSCHPSNSVIGIGAGLNKIFSSHNYKTKSYSVMQDIINMNNSKFLMIGTLDDKNAPQGMHMAQEDLGYTKYSFFSRFFQIYFYENGVKKIFKRKDIGGCSSGGYKLYGHLIINDSIKYGKIGNAYSALMPAKKSYEIIRSYLKKNPGYSKCENNNCISCYGHPIYNRSGFIIFYLRRLPFFLKKIIKYLVKNIN